MRKLTAEKKNEIAFKVALDWLKFAERVIQRGDNPAKLSATAYGHVEDFFIDLNDEKSFPSKNQISEIAALAVQEAKHFFFLGKFEVVKHHFSTNLSGESCYRPDDVYRQA